MRFLINMVFYMRQYNYIYVTFTKWYPEIANSRFPMCVSLDEWFRSVEIHIISSGRQMLTGGSRTQGCSHSQWCPWFSWLLNYTLNWSHPPPPPPPPPFCQSGKNSWNGVPFFTSVRVVIYYPLPRLKGPQIAPEKQIQLGSLLQLRHFYVSLNWHNK